MTWGWRTVDLEGIHVRAYGESTLPVHLHYVPFRWLCTRFGIDTDTQLSHLLEMGITSEMIAPQGERPTRMLTVADTLLWLACARVRPRQQRERFLSSRAALLSSIREMVAAKLSSEKK